MKTWLKKVCCFFAGHNWLRNVKHAKGYGSTTWLMPNCQRCNKPWNE